jgi:hypothetical protein
LVVAVLLELTQRWINGTTLANGIKGLLLMGINIGAFGVLLLCVQVFAEKSLAKTHAVVQAIPVPTPYLLIHFVIFSGLFYLHAYVWGAPVWPIVSN